MIPHQCSGWGSNPHGGCSPGDFRADPPPEPGHTTAHHGGSQAPRGAVLFRVSSDISVSAAWRSIVVPGFCMIRFLGSRSHLGNVVFAPRSSTSGPWIGTAGRGSSWFGIRHDWSGVARRSDRLGEAVSRIQGRSFALVGLRSSPRTCCAQAGDGWFGLWNYRSCTRACTSCTWHCRSGICACT